MWSWKSARFRSGRGSGNCRATGSADLGTRARRLRHAVLWNCRCWDEIRCRLRPCAPGVIPTRGQVGVGGDAIGSATNSRISGGLAMQNAVLMDGGDTRGFTSGGQAYVLPLESVAEFKIETATYSAEFGRAGGGVVNVASKSGTNRVPRRSLRISAQRPSERELVVQQPDSRASHTLSAQ